MKEEKAVFFSCQFKSSLYLAVIWCFSSKIYRNFVERTVVWKLEITSAHADYPNWNELSKEINISVS